MSIEHDPEGAELAALTAVIPSFAGHRVLEVGCGDGRLTRRYAAAAASVTAVDPDADAIAECRAAAPLPHVNAYTIPFEQFIAPPASYDIVLMSWAL
jgi:2-polyprenyl-3-methyl-5-hydroxy-6-metoxy-1,4-benzoquinol methylase